jgi:hypothetical protein
MFVPLFENEPRSLDVFMFFSILEPELGFKGKFAGAGEPAAGGMARMGVM